MKKATNFLKTKALKFQTAAMMRMAGVKEQRENGDHLLEVLGTMIVAVVLLLIFKDQIAALFNNLISKVNLEISTLFPTSH